MCFTFLCITFTLTHWLRNTRVRARLAASGRGGGSPRTTALSTGRTHRHSAPQVLCYQLTLLLPSLISLPRLLSRLSQKMYMIFLLLFYVRFLNTLLPARGSPERKLDILCPERLPVPTKMKQSPSPRGGNEDKTRSLHKRDSLKGVQSLHKRLAALRAKGFRKATPVRKPALA